jgi:hypothetical protein
MPTTAQAVLTHRVDEVALPSSVRALSTLGRIDYSDAFRLSTSRAGDRTAQEWARAMIEDAPAAMRTALRRGWCGLGLRLGSTSDPVRVLGWPVRQSTEDHAVLAADSLLGMRAELCFLREPGAILFATVIRMRNPLARAVWAPVGPRHRRVVRHLLEQAGRRAEHGSGTYV